MAHEHEINDQLQDAAERGDIEMLYTLLRGNPKIFDLMDKELFVDSPLHIAASTGDSAHDQTDDSSLRMAEFAVEMAIIMPSFTRKLNPDGLTPMHLALLHGNWKTVRALMTHDPELIRVKGKGGKTPLHVAAEVAPPQLLAELLYFCPSSIEDVTAQSKTALHVAVEKEHFESFAVLLGWLSRVDKEALLYWKDMGGNTVLHAATRTNQIEVVRSLLRHMEDGVENFKGETALTIHENKIGPERSEEIGSVLRPGKKIHLAALQPVRHIFALGNYLGSDLSEVELLLRRTGDAMARGGFEKSRELAIVIAILVATATYQGVLNPPGGFWQNDSSNTNTTAHSAGKVAMSGGLLSTYILTNSFAFVASLSVIISCMPGNFIFGLYLVSCTVALLLTYLFAIHIILPPDNTYLRGGVDVWIGATILIAVIALSVRLWLVIISDNTPKLNAAERGQLWGLVRRDDKDADGQRNQRGNADHTIDTGGLQGPEGP